MVAGGVNERISLGRGGQAQGDDEAKECECDLAGTGEHDGYVGVETVLQREREEGGAESYSQVVGWVIGKRYGNNDVLRGLG